MIRKAQINDIDLINELGIQANSNFLNTYNILKYLNDSNYIILVNKECKINAFMILYKNIDYYELELIVVDKDFRNKKIATKLFNYFETNYLKTGDIILLEVAINNENAIKLYKKFNFETINIRKKYYDGIDAYVMKKVIE